MNFLVAVVTGAVCVAVGVLVFHLPSFTSGVIGVIGYVGGRIAGMVEK